MSKYIHYFNNENDFDEMRSVENYDEPWLSLTEYNLDENIPVTDEEIPDVARVDYNKTEEEKERERLLGTPLTFEIQSDGEIVWKTSSGNTKTIEYSKNGGEWTSITSSTGGTSISVVNGDTVQFRGNNSSYFTSSSRYNTFSGSTAQFSVKGNIMSLINSTNFSGLTEFPSNSSYNFCNLFKNTSVLASQSLVLPATTLTSYCYQNMFNDCTSLTGAPELPATTLAMNCYREMFNGCTSLTTAPALPATTLANYCYYNMFYGCSNLTGAPALPATTLAERCYNGMFRDCTSLTTAPSVLPATTLASNCYDGMFFGCTSLVNAPALPATTLAERCYNGMFRDCTSLTTAPELPATTLGNYCYSQMFYNCTSLTGVPSDLLPATNLSGTTGCYSSMFYGCSGLTTAPELPATTLGNYCYSQMFSNCYSLNYIKCLATDISATNCTLNWVNGVPNSGRFVKNSSMSDWTTGSNGIPANWTVQDAS